MKNRKIIILFTLLLSMGLFTRGICQEPADKLVLSLQGAIDHAISFNKPLKNARLEVERSRARNWEAISQGLPQVDAGMDYSSYFNYEMEFSFGMGDMPDFSQDQYIEAWNQTVTEFPTFTPADLNNYAAGTYYQGILN